MRFQEAVLLLALVPLTLGRWHGRDHHPGSKAPRLSSTAQLLARMRAARAALDVLEAPPTPVPTPLPPTPAPTMDVGARLGYFLHTGHWPGTGGAPAIKKPAAQRVARKVSQDVSQDVSQALDALTRRGPRPRIELRGRRVVRTFALPGQTWADPGAACSRRGVAGLPAERGRIFTTGDIPDLAVAGVYTVRYGCTVERRAARGAQRTVIVMRPPQPRAAAAATPAPTPRAKPHCKHGRTVGMWSACDTMCGAGRQYRRTLTLHCDSWPFNHQSKPVLKREHRRCELRPCRRGMVERPRRKAVPALGASSRQVDQWQDDDHELSGLGQRKSKSWQHMLHNFGRPTTTHAPTVQVPLGTRQYWQYLLNMAAAQVRAAARSKKRQHPPR
jgi:hypothetical protein